MDIHYSQSAIFTPSDFTFPHDAVKAKATPNTETTLIADLDLGLLKELNQHGAVRNLRQRRLDLYRINWVGDNAVSVRKPVCQPDAVDSKKTEERGSATRKHVAKG